MSPGTEREASALSAAKLEASAKMLMAFTSGGRYTDAKNAARALKSNIAEATSAPDSVKMLKDLARELDLLVEATLRLPDSAVIDRSEEMAASQEAKPGPERYHVGAEVKVASVEVLKRLMRPHYKYHDPVVSDQLKYAGLLTRVKKLIYYFGGDVVYSLEKTERFVWHEECLEAAKS